MVLRRWEPFRDLSQMENTMNQVWRGFGGLPSYHEGAENWNILIDVLQKKDVIEVKASIPGVKAEGIEVTVEDSILTLRVERKSEIEEEDSTYLIQERPTGSFYRALRLPDTVDTDKIKSHYEDGVLNIIMPKAEKKKKKLIQITSN